MQDINFDKDGSDRWQSLGKHHKKMVKMQEEVKPDVFEIEVFRYCICRHNTGLGLFMMVTVREEWRKWISQAVPTGTEFMELNDTMKL